MNSHNQTKKAGVLGLLVLLGVGACWLWLRPVPKTRSQLPTPSTQNVEKETKPSTAHYYNNGGNKNPENTSPIAAITLEKTRVCEGEENLVRVHLRTPIPEQTRVYVGHESGTLVPVKAWLNEQNQAPETLVRVDVGDGKVFTQKVPRYTVEKCKPKARVAITRTLLPNSTDEYQFRVLVKQPENDTRKIVDYHWYFGDDERSDGSDVVTHNYEHRSQDTEFSYFLVAVDVVLDNGDHLYGRHSVELNNLAHHFDNLGFVMLFPHFTPRFPVENEDGVVEQTVRLRHYHKESVVLQRAKIVTSYLDDNRRDSKEHSVKKNQEEEVDPASIVGTKEIPDGKGVEFQVRMDTKLHPGIAYQTFFLEGKTDSGKPVRGSFSVLRPPPKPTAENHVEVESEMMQKKIQLAMKKLKKPYITFDEMQKLEREGAFKDLENSYN
jgi:hypothetical protein